MPLSKKTVTLLRKAAKSAEDDGVLFWSYLLQNDPDVELFTMCSEEVSRSKFCDLTQMALDYLRDNDNKASKVLCQQDEPQPRIELIN